MSTDTGNARNPRAEAQAVAGDGYDARVLEPSPPAVDDGEWFADDPVAVGSGRRGAQVLSPVSRGDVTWDEWLADHPDRRGWAADRWLGARRRVPAPPDDLPATRVALHRLAAYVLSPARRRANGKIAVRWTRGGFGTPFFGSDVQVRLDGTDLVVQHGSSVRTLPITTLADAAEFVLDGPPDVSWWEGFDVPSPGERDEPLAVDADAAAWLSDWFGLAYAVLEELRADAASEDASRVQLWPEHFDAAFECLPESEGRRAVFGLSPGDAAVPVPYVYVSLWTPDRVDTGGDLWNAEHFPGAILEVEDLVDAQDQVAAAVSFLRTRRDALLRAAV